MQPEADFDVRSRGARLILRTDATSRHQAAGAVAIPRSFPVARLSLFFRHVDVLHRLYLGQTMALNHATQRVAKNHRDGGFQWPEAVSECRFSEVVLTDSVAGLFRHPPATLQRDG
jgi:hypothetical protein